MVQTLEPRTNHPIDAGAARELAELHARRQGVAVTPAIRRAARGGSQPAAEAAQEEGRDPCLRSSSD